MFDLKPETGAITLSKGDTASFEVEAVREDGVPFTSDDRAVFSIYQDVTPVIERIYTLDNDEDETLGNGVFRVELTNADTDSLAAGNYTWEVRYTVGAYFDQETGRVVSGDAIDTPGIDGNGNPMPFVLKPVQYHI